MSCLVWVALSELSFHIMCDQIRNAVADPGEGCGMDVYTPFAQSFFSEDITNP